MYFIILLDVDFNSILPELILVWYARNFDTKCMNICQSFSKFNDRSFDYLPLVHIHSHTTDVAWLLHAKCIFGRNIVSLKEVYQGYPNK